MINIRRVLVATDFSEIADGALDYGRALAEHFGGTLHVLHVADVLQPIAVGVEGYFADVSDLQREVDEAARQQLDACLARKGISAGITVPVVLTSPMVAQTIVDYASEQQIDVVVVGTHGRGGLSRLVMGSVAERVVRTAECPVLTVHGQERELRATKLQTAAAIN